MRSTTQRASLATKLLLPAVAVLALAGAWTAMAAQNDAPTATGHVVLDPGTGEAILFGELVSMTTEAVPGDKRDRPNRPSVVLRRGLTSNNAIWTWHAQVRAGDAGARRDATLTIYDAQNEVLARWKLAAARPTKVQVSDLNAASNEVAIETIELAAEGLDIDP